MDKFEIVNLICEAEKADNKTKFLSQKSVSRATYYMWLRKYKKGGVDALTTLNQITWSAFEIEKITNAFDKKSEVSYANLLEILPSRTKKAIEAKIAELGYSVEIHNAKIARETVDKKCAKCDKIKNKTEFYAVKSGSIDGYHSYCKQCVLFSQKDYRERNETEIKQRDKIYRKRRLEDDRHYSAKLNQNWRLTAKGAYATLLNRHKSKNRRGAANFNISYEDFENWYDNENKCCSYCGVSQSDYQKISFNLVGVARKTNVLTIDRIDSNKPYENNNICFACYVCNQSKGYIFDASEFKEIAQEFISPKMMQFVSKIKKCNQK
jgi:hypothetical protein